jgi:hypothetical protein
VRHAAAALAIGLLAAAAATSAEAQRRIDPAAILGVWRFETERYDIGQDGGCRMSGTMTIAAGRTANAYVCRFTATETCAWGEWSAEQTCTAERQGDRLDITSTIVRLSPPNISYAPDNWSLTIRSPDLMVGELRSADIAGVQFRRGPAIIS